MASATFCVQAAKPAKSIHDRESGNRTPVAVLRQSSSVKNVQVLNVRVVLQKQSDDGDNHSWATPTLALAEENPRETPLVRAVRESRKSVVNIHTEKSASEDKDARFFTARPPKVTGWEQESWSMNAAIS